MTHGSMSAHTGLTEFLFEKEAACWADKVKLDHACEWALHWPMAFIWHSIARSSHLNGSTVLMAQRCKVQPPEWFHGGIMMPRSQDGNGVE